MDFLLDSFFGLGSYLPVLRGYSLLCTQYLFLLVVGGPYELQGVEPRLAVCRASTLPTVLLLWPLDFVSVFVLLSV